MKEITAYQCEYCNRVYKTKSYMKKHEAMCFLNPSNRACWMCEYNLGCFPDHNKCMCGKFNRTIEDMSNILNLRYYEKQAAVQQCKYFQLKNTHKCGYCKHKKRTYTEINRFNGGYDEEEEDYDYCDLKKWPDVECTEDEMINGCPNFEKK